MSTRAASAAATTSSLVLTWIWKGFRPADAYTSRPALLVCPPPPAARQVDLTDRLAHNVANRREVSTNVAGGGAAKQLSLSCWCWCAYLVRG